MGRRRKSGERYPSGGLKKPKRQEAEPISGVLLQRIRQHAKLAVIDPRMLTELMRLHAKGELTVAQTTAGLRVAEIYGRFEGYKRKGRSTRSPSYNASYGEAGIAEELLTEEGLALLESRIRDATESWNNLQKFIDTRAPRLRGAIETLCVEDCAINPTLYDEMRDFLGHLAVAWRMTAGAPHQPSGRSHATRGPALHFNKHEDAPAEDGAPAQPSAPKPVNIDRMCFFLVQRKFTPKLSDETIATVYEIFQVLKQREIFRLSKLRRKGNVVPIR